MTTNQRTNIPSTPIRDASAPEGYKFISLRDDFEAGGPIVKVLQKIGTEESRQKNYENTMHILDLIAEDTEKKQYEIINQMAELHKSGGRGTYHFSCQCSKGSVRATITDIRGDYKCSHCIIAGHVNF